MHRALLVSLLLSAFLSFVLADYGREEKDIGPPEELLGLDSEKSVDDADIPADDEALENVEKESQELAEKLKEMEHLRSRIKYKNELLKRVQSLRTKLNETEQLEEQAKEQEEKVEESVSQSMKKKNETYDAKEQIANERRQIEQKTHQVEEEDKKFEVELARVEQERKRKEADEKELQLEQERLVKEMNALLSQFKDHGMHTWLAQNVKRFPPVIRETIMKSSAVLNPVLDSVEGVAEINEQLTNETTEAITHYLPAIKNSPFYTGLIFYIILLCPLVAVIWLVMKIRARLSLMTIEHYLIAINMYFGILSLACALMTMVGKTDILIVFRHRAQRLAESFMILHGLLFIVHLVLHGITAYVSGSRKDFSQYIGISFVGLHFFTNAYKRTILDQDPNIGAPAYIVYAIFFLYTLYDRGVNVLEAAVKDDKSNVAGFRTYGSSSQNLPVTNASKEKRDSTVYFAGLPVFNGPAQMSLDDAKNI